MTYGPVEPAADCKAIFAHPNVCLDPLAQISATTEEVGAPADYLLADDSSTAWRSTSTAETDIWFRLSDDSSFPVGLVGLLFNQSSKDTRCRARLYSVSQAAAMAGAAAVYDSGALRAWTPYGGGDVLPWGEFTWGGVPPPAVLASRPRHWIHPVMSNGTSVRALSCRTVRVTITGSASVSYWQAAMLWVSTAYLPSRNLSLADFSRSWEDLSILVRGSNGRRQVLDRGRLRRLGLLFPGQDRFALDQRLEAWASQVGTGGPLLVIPEPGQPTTWWNDAGPYSLEELGGSRREVSMSDLWEAPVSLLEWR